MLPRGALFGAQGQNPAVGSVGSVGSVGKASVDVAAASHAFLAGAGVRDAPSTLPMPASAASLRLTGGSPGSVGPGSVGSPAGPAGLPAGSNGSLAALFESIKVRVGFSYYSSTYY